MVFTAGKRRGRWGGIRHLGNPPSSAELRPPGPWPAVEIRGPILLETLALYSYDFWKYKSRKNWKRIVILEEECTFGSIHIWPVGLNLFASAHIHPLPARALLVSLKGLSSPITFFYIHFTHLYHCSLTESLSAAIHRRHATVCGSVAC